MDRLGHRIELAEARVDHLDLLFARKGENRIVRTGTGCRSRTRSREDPGIGVARLIGASGQVGRTALTKQGIGHANAVLQRRVDRDGQRFGNGAAIIGCRQGNG